MKETSLLVDRYKYLDLYPCTNQELRAMDYQVLTESLFRLLCRHVITGLLTTLLTRKTILLTFHLQLYGVT